MKSKVIIIGVCCIIWVLSSCSASQTNVNFTPINESKFDCSTTAKTETSITYLFDEQMINSSEIIKEEINSTDNSTYTDLGTTTYFCEEVASESALDDENENVNLDTEIIENFFLGIWKADNEHGFIIGENTECDALDFFDNYGLIKKLI